MEQFEQITCISLKSFRFLFFFLVRNTIYQSHSSSGEIYHEGLLQSENLQIYKLSWVQNNIFEIPINRSSM